MYEEMSIICGDNNNQVAPDLSGSSSEEAYSDNDDLDVSDDMIKESSRSPPYDASAYVLSKRRHCQGKNGKFSSLLYLYLLIKAATYKIFLSVNGAGTVKPHSPVWQPRSSKKGCTNFRWSPYMSRFLLSYIVDQIKLGLVKRQILMAAAQFVGDKFNVNCNMINVENHLRTVRGRYMRIKKLQTIENATWEDEMKMIVMDDMSYHEHIKVPVTEVISFLFSFCIILLCLYL
jgi:Myb/SANT-like DNA-binding domain